MRQRCEATFTEKHDKVSSDAPADLVTQVVRLLEGNNPQDLKWRTDCQKRF